VGVFEHLIDWLTVLSALIILALLKPDWASKLQTSLGDKIEAKEKEQVWQMFSGFLRELAVLMLAFYPLEQQYFRTRLGFTEVLIGSLTCLIIGIVIERRR
jgi:hypothetical protein